MIQNKTSNFLKAIENYSRAQIDEIEKETEEYRQAQLNEGKERALRDAYNLIQTELNTSKSAVISEYSRKIADSKRNLYDRRNEMISEIRKDVIKKLSDFTKTDEYAVFIENSLKNTKKYINDEECIIEISKNDSKTKESIKKHLNVQDVKETGITGGYKAYAPSLGIMIDESLDSRLDDQMEIFIQQCGLKVI